MITKIVRSYIQVGAKAVRPLERMIQSAKRHNHNDVWPWEFTCMECRTRWGGSAIAVGVELPKVSCSNCYSEFVRLTKLKIEVCEASDFDLRPTGRLLVGLTILEREEERR